MLLKIKAFGEEKIKRREGDFPRFFWNSQKKILSNQAGPAHSDRRVMSSIN